jgi:hypothetical protein
MKHLSVVIHDLDAVGIAALPAEADSPLIIDANAVLAFAVSFERLELVPRRGLQIL